MARLTSFRVLPSPRNIDPTDQNRCSLDLKMSTSLRTETCYLTLVSRTSQANINAEFTHLRPATKRDNHSCALRVRACVCVCRTPFSFTDNPKWGTEHLFTNPLIYFETHNFVEIPNRGDARREKKKKKKETTKQCMCLSA